MNNNADILFVENEQALLNLYKGWSESLYHSFFFAADGPHALDLLHQHRIDIVLTNIKMPNMDGIQLLKHIKENFPTIDVIVCSGHPETFRIDDALNAGAIDYLWKPFSISELKLKIKRVMRERELVQHLNTEITLRDERQIKLEMAQKALDMAVDPIYWLTEDGKFIYANQSAARQIGYSVDELLTMSVFDLNPFFPVESWPIHWQELQVKGSKVLESIHRTKDGRDFPVEITANYNLFNSTAYNFAYVRNISEHRNIEQKLRNARDELEKRVHKKTEQKNRDLSILLGQVVEEERKRIAANLHDEFGQLLFSFNYKMADIKKKVECYRYSQLYEDFTTLDIIFQQLADCCRDITTRLSPPVFDDRSFIPALEWTVDNLKEMLNNDIEISFKISTPIPTMSKYIKIVIYRVLQESLNNIAKYASPKKVSTVLSLNDSQIILTIADDGIGFETAALTWHKAKQGGFGLQAMRERLSSLDGNLDITSQPGKGTTIKATIPLKA